MNIVSTCKRHTGGCRGMAIEHVIRHAVKAVDRQQQCIEISKVSLYELTESRRDVLGGVSESRQHVQQCVIPRLAQASGQSVACVKLGQLIQFSSRYGMKQSAYSDSLQPLVISNQIYVRLYRGTPNGIID